MKILNYKFATNAYFFRLSYYVCCWWFWVPNISKLLPTVWSWVCAQQTWYIGTYLSLQTNHSVSDHYSIQTYNLIDCKFFGNIFLFNKRRQKVAAAPNYKSHILKHKYKSKFCREFGSLFVLCLCIGFRSSDTIFNPNLYLYLSWRS